MLTIKFTVENIKEDGSIPFLDTIVKPEVNGSLSITVYRKPSHTDQYLQWGRHHNLSIKFSVNNTLSHRAQTVCSNPELLKQEKEHLRKALTKCKYPKWALDKVEKRLNRPSSEAIDGLNSQGANITPAATRGVKSKGHIVIPYKVFVKASKRSVVGMGSKLTSKVATPSRTSWSALRTKTPWSPKVMPSIGINVGTSPVMMNT